MPSEGIGAAALNGTRPQLEAALAHAAMGELTIEDVAERVRDGRLQLWAAEGSALVTEILTFPRATILHFYLAGGTQPVLEAMLEPILAWGKSKGCTHAALTGRAGWERSFLKRLGWKPYAIQMGRPL